MRWVRYGLAFLILAYVVWSVLGPSYDYAVPPPSKSLRGSSQRSQSAELPKPPREVVLLFSGGGYRAMLFHLGALWRLNEAGLLPEVAAISSVSGGSIAAAIVGLKWKNLNFDHNGVAQNFSQEVIAPARVLASRDVDLRVLAQSAIPWSSAAQGVIAAYRAHVFGNSTLQDLPDRPLVFIHATNLQSGLGWTFSKRYMGDGRVGVVRQPTVEIAVAVAASSAFPPFLSPVILKVDPTYYELPQLPFMDLHRSPYTNRVFLTDGGVYDNIGFMSGGKIDVVMVSDASLRTLPEESPWRDWLSQTRRVLDLIHAQPARFRIDQLLDKRRDEAQAAYIWTINDSLQGYPPGLVFPTSPNVIKALAMVPTRLRGMGDSVQKQLINLGYAVADAELRVTRIYPKHSASDVRKVSPYAELPPGKGWPYPECELRLLTC